MSGLRTWVCLFCLTIAWRIHGERHKRQGGTSFGGNSRRSSDCSLPNGAPGNCIPLPECLPYAETAQRLRENINFLRDVTCHYDRFNPIVCCPIGGGGQNESPTVSPTQRPPPTPNPNTNTQVPCGDSSKFLLKMVGRFNASLGDWPWVVAIFMDDNNGEPQPVCGGSLLNNEYILTAGHCTMDKAGRRHPVRAFSVRLGDLNLQSDSDGASPQTVRVSRVITHPDFNPANFHNDIALMKLSKPVTFTEFIKPVCLPTSVESGDDFAGQHPILVGWGTTGFEQTVNSVLQYLQIPIQTQQVCEQSYRDFRATLPIISSQMCAGYLTGFKDYCLGDSGDPLLVVDRSREKYPFMVIGIASFGFRCTKGLPGIYTRVTAYLDWIHENMK